jgi:hypothetical protein
MAGVEDCPSAWEGDHRTWGMLGRRSSLPNRLLRSLWLGFLLLPLLGMWGRRGVSLTHEILATVITGVFAGCSSTPRPPRIRCGSV